MDRGERRPAHDVDRGAKGLRLGAGLLLVKEKGLVEAYCRLVLRLKGQELRLRNADTLAEVRDLALKLALLASHCLQPALNGRLLH